MSTATTPRRCANAQATAQPSATSHTGRRPTTPPTMPRQARSNRHRGHVLYVLHVLHVPHIPHVMRIMHPAMPGVSSRAGSYTSAYQAIPLLKPAFFLPAPDRALAPRVPASCSSSTASRHRTTARHAMPQQAEGGHRGHVSHVLHVPHMPHMMRIMRPAIPTRVSSRAGLYISPYQNIPKDRPDRACLPRWRISGDYRDCGDCGRWGGRTTAGRAGDSARSCGADTETGGQPW